MSDLSGVNLDPNVEESGDGFSIIPPGKYNAVLVSDILKETAKKNGKYLEMIWQITEGELLGQTIISRLNVVNQNDIAQKIGQGQLKKICSLCNVQFPPKDTTGLSGKTICITVKETKFVSNTTGKELTGQEIVSYSKKQELQAETGSCDTPVGGAW